MQLVNMGRMDEAWETIRKATALSAPAAAVARPGYHRPHRGDEREEKQALTTACDINPQWGQAVRSLCSFHERHGDLQASRRLLEQLVGFTPLDAAHQVMLAETLWRLDEREAALERVRHVAGFEPGYARVWVCLNAWTREMNCRDVALETARALTQERGGEPRSWLIAARAYDLPEELDARLAALDKALELNPECVDAFDLRARSLAAARRWEEAYAACRPAVFKDDLPVELRARGAWIAAEQGDRMRAVAEMRQVVAESPAIFDALVEPASMVERGQRRKGQPGSGGGHGPHRAAVRVQLRLPGRGPPHEQGSRRSHPGLSPCPGTETGV